MTDPIKRKRIHPYKFAMILSMGSMAMLFAALTSAYIVKRNQIGWKSIDIPTIFYISTLVIVLNSVILSLCKSYFLKKEKTKYRQYMLIGLGLGILFILLQSIGFSQMISQGILLRTSVVGSFIYIIAGLHALHVLGGIIALLIILIKDYRRIVKIYSVVGIDIVAIYWHFIDFLWIYLLVFFLIFP